MQNILARNALYLQAFQPATAGSPKKVDNQKKKRPIMESEVIHHYNKEVRMGGGEVASIPAGMQIVKGGTVEVRNTASISTMPQTVRDLYVDARPVKEGEFLKFLEKYLGSDDYRYTMNVVGPIIQDVRNTDAARAVSTDYGEAYCASMDKRLPTLAETVHLMKLRQPDFTVRPFKKGNAFSWVTSSTTYRIGGSPRDKGVIGYAAHSPGSMAYDAGLFCVKAAK